MKYEIRIISEEDTVKSKVYDDLNKAIEIADKIYNDFIDLDYGDEIVVVEANNKNSAYYWGNGKQFIYSLSIGDKVKVIDNGKTYSTYQDFMIEYGTKEDCCNWVKHKTPQENEDVYEIINIATHPLRETAGQLAIIRNVDYTQDTYIVGVKGLAKV